MAPPYPRVRPAPPRRIRLCPTVDFQISRGAGEREAQRALTAIVSQARSGGRRGQGSRQTRQTRPWLGWLRLLHPLPGRPGPRLPCSHSLDVLRPAAGRVVCLALLLRAVPPRPRDRPPRPAAPGAISAQREYCAWPVFFLTFSRRFRLFHYPQLGSAVSGGAPRHLVGLPRTTAGVAQRDAEGGMGSLLS